MATLKEHFEDLILNHKAEIAEYKGILFTENLEPSTVETINQNIEVLEGVLARETETLKKYAPDN